MPGDSVTSSESILSTSSVDSQFDGIMRKLRNNRDRSINDQQKQQVKTGDVLVHFNWDGNKEISLPKLAAKVSKNSHDLDLTVRSLDLMIKKIINCVRQELSVYNNKN
jgi:hypothetical protein